MSFLFNKDKNYHCFCDNDIDLIDISINDVCECIVCYDKSSANNEVCFLKELVPNYKVKQLCECNPPIHVNCLNLWFVESLSCPVCRKDMEKVPTCYDNLCEKYNDCEVRYYFIVVAIGVVFLYVILFGKSD